MAETSQHTTSEVEFFDRLVDEHGDYDVLSEGAYARLIDAFHRWVRPRRGERAVDLGCGTGAFTRRLRSFGLELQGMDISPKSVALANKTATSERYVCGDITATNLPAGSFDIVLYSGVLHHFATREARATVLAEGFRLLAPGGRLFAYDPNLHSPSMWLYRDPRSPLFSSKGKTENEVLLRKSELLDELHTAGFAEVQVRGLSGITYRWVASPIARTALTAYNLYEHAMAVSPFEDRLGTFLISVATKAPR
ncbi:MAG TPA: methyltransferase domain-containing protein [Polyangiaceae bacterium]|nr:methyltransferase domain-containing protein [Polyangiaceae bacterium]